MGNGNAYFLDAISRTPLRLTPVRHESGTVAAADAFYRATRSVAVATTTFGPGFTNTITALAEAVMANSPVLLVTGGAPASGRRGVDVDQTAIATAVGAESFVLDTQTPRETTLRALHHSLTHLTPVVLTIPYDIAAAEADAETHCDLAGMPGPRTASPEVLDEAAKALMAAQRPLVLAGRGAVQAGPGLITLGERLGALMATTAPARGLFAGEEFDIGVAGGFSSEKTAALISESDVVLVVGARLNQFTTAHGKFYGGARHVIQVDIADQATHPVVDIFVRSDSADAVRGILSRIPAGQEPGETWRSAAPHARSGLHFQRDAGQPLAADGRLDPRSLAIQLNAALPQERIVVSDGGHFSGWSSLYFDLPSTDRLLLVGTNYMTIGLGFAAAVGACVARPESMTVLAIGDGSGLMALADIESLARAAQRAVVIVFNDAAYSAEVIQYGSQGQDLFAMTIPEVDFATLANGAGARGVVVRTLDDLAVLTDWVESGQKGTLVLDCRISNSVIAPHYQEIMKLLHVKSPSHITGNRDQLK